MKKILVTLLIASAVSANALKTRVKPGITFKNVHGTVESGAWVIMKLQNDVAPLGDTQEWIAKISTPVFNKKFNEVLIPANSIVKGKYHNDGEQCSFTVDSISFRDTEIILKPGAYSEVDAALPNLPECSSKAYYTKNQLMTFQLKIKIPDLAVVQSINPEPVRNDNNYVQAVTTDDYSIQNLSKFSNGIIKTIVRVRDEWLDVNKLVPIFYDDYGIPHNLNYYVLPLSKDTYEYVIYSNFDSFGFGIMEK